CTENAAAPAVTAKSEIRPPAEDAAGSDVGFRVLIDSANAVSSDMICPARPSSHNRHRNLSVSSQFVNCRWNRIAFRPGRQAGTGGKSSHKNGWLLAFRAAQNATNDCLA